MSEQPNVIVDGRGYRVFSKVLDWQTWKGTRSTQRKPIDQRKTCVRLFNVTDVIDIWPTVLNDSPDNDDDFTFSAIETTRPAGFTFRYLFAGVAQVLPYDLTVPARNRIPFQVEITAPDPFIRGEIASVIVTAHSKTSGDVNAYTDSIMIAAVGQLVSYQDIVDVSEDLITTEVLNPVWHLVGAQDVIQKFIDQETEMVLRDFLDSMQGIQIYEYEKLQNYLTYRVLHRAVSRATQDAVDGGAMFVSTLNALAEQANTVWQAIQYGR